jgi:hypothetical protein
MPTTFIKVFCIKQKKKKKKKGKTIHIFVSNIYSLILLAILKNQYISTILLIVLIYFLIFF